LSDLAEMAGKSRDNYKTGFQNYKIYFVQELFCMTNFFHYFNILTSLLPSVIQNNTIIQDIETYRDKLLYKHMMYVWTRAHARACAHARERFLGDDFV
jgi:hypothetical protein